MKTDRIKISTAATAAEGCDMNHDRVEKKEELA